MGYTTDFKGKFACTPPLTEAHAEYLRSFRGTRRMKRNPAIAATLPDAVREAVGLPIGEDGAYFVGGGGFHGQGNDASIIAYNDEPRGQHGLWCQWVPSDDGTAIEWDGGEKFSNYTEWLVYLIEHFLKPWGYTLNGKVEWDGGDREDIGTITVVSNDVTAKAGLQVAASDDGIGINELVREAHQTAKAKGWHKPHEDLMDFLNREDVPEWIAEAKAARFGTLMALIHTEVSEAVEAYRVRGIEAWTREDGKPEGVPSELADVLVRVADVCGALGIDLNAAVEAKLAYNRTRSHRHGGKAL